MTVLGIYSWTRLWSMGDRRGAESFYLSLHSFVKHGHEIHVIAPREPGQPLEEDLDGIHIHRLATGFNFVPKGNRNPVALRVAERIVKYVAFQIAAGRAALRLGRRIRPDVVVAFGAFSVRGARWAARRLGVPNVTRMFGQWLADCYGNRLKYYADFPDIYAFTTPSSAIILHDDGSDGDEMAKVHRVPPERFFYWKNGVAPDLYRPDMNTAAVRAEMGFGPDDILLFGVARMYSEKHLERAIEIMPRLLEAEPRVRLFLVGDGPMRAGLEALSRDMGVDHAVRFVGAQSREDLYKFFNTGDVFLSLADRTNGGNPTVEAMYCGRCVVVLNTGGTAKLVEDGVTGVVVEPSELGALADRVLAVVRDPALRRRLGEAAREKITPQVPTIEERQRMEVDVVENAVREWREARAGEAPDTRRRPVPTH